MVACGEPRLCDHSGAPILNPIAIFEVLSPSTEAYDRRRKFDLCARADSLREYILINQDEARAESFTRQPDGSWVRRLFTGLEAKLSIESIEVELPLADIYDRVEFEALMNQEQTSLEFPPA